jgi:sugar lactone lactonase YvrE
MKTIITTLGIAFCLNINAQIINTVVGTGTASYCCDGGQATAAELNNPAGVALDASGNMYIADYYNNRIRKVSTLGIISTFAGNGTGGFSGDGGQATNAELSLPDAVAFDGAGNLYISDYVNNRIRMVSTSGIITTVAGSATQGYSGDGGQATNAELYGPTGVTTDASNNIYIADYSNNRIRMVNSAGIITTVAGIGPSGSAGSYSGDGGQATAAALNLPGAVAVDAVGNIYISDWNNNRLRMVNTGGIITTIVGTGTQGYSGDGGQATAAEINGPQVVVFDAAGNFYMGDGGNFRVRKINTAGIINTVVGNGTQGFSGDGAAAINAELDYPYCLALDAFNNLYIVDANNERIRKVSSAGQPTSIEQITNSNEVNIYPNPNNGSFVIEPSSATKQTMQVYDITGKMVLSQIINGKTSIDGSSLNEGVYNISLQSNEGVVNKRLVIVR